MYSGCKKSFASCLHLSTGDYVFTSGGWLLKADQQLLLGTDNTQLSDRPWKKHLPCSHHAHTHTCKREQITHAAIIYRKIWNILKWLLGMENTTHLWLMRLTSLRMISALNPTSQ